MIYTDMEVLNVAISEPGANWDIKTQITVGIILEYLNPLGFLHVCVSIISKTEIEMGIFSRRRMIG